VDRALGRKHCRDRFLRPRESRAEGVSDRLEHVPAVRRDRRTHQLVVAPDGNLHRGPVAIPTLRATFDVGKGERDRPARRSVSHAAPLRAGRRANR